MKCPALLNLLNLPQPRSNIDSSLEGTAWRVRLSFFHMSSRPPFPFFSGLTSVSAAPSPAGFSGQESCVQTQSSVTKSANRGHVGKQALQANTSRQIMPGKVSNVICFTRSVMRPSQCVSLGWKSISYLWQLLGEMVTEGSKGLAADSHLIAQPILVQALTGRKTHISNGNKNSYLHHCTH